MAGFPKDPYCIWIKFSEDVILSIVAWSQLDIRRVLARLALQFVSYYVSQPKSLSKVRLFSGEFNAQGLKFCDAWGKKWSSAAGRYFMWRLLIRSRQDLCGRSPKPLGYTQWLLKLWSNASTTLYYILIPQRIFEAPLPVPTLELFLVYYVI